MGIISTSATPTLGDFDGRALPAGVELSPADVSRDQNWPAIWRHLAESGLRLDPDVLPRRFAGGLANLNYLLRLESPDASGNSGDGWVVLRRPPLGPLPPGANDMAREHKILSRLPERLALAPRSYHLCADTSITGAAFQLLEFREGVTIRGDSLAPLSPSPATGSSLSRLLIASLAAVHAVDPATVGLSDLGRPVGFLERTARGWADRAQRVCGEALSLAAREVASWLQRYSRGLGGDGHLLHNDFKLDNMILDPSSLSPVAILDWDMGTRGDALLDLATLLSYWTEPGDPDCMHRLAQMPTARPGFMSRQEAADAYALATRTSLQDFKVYRVMGMFKLGVVFHQLHRRYTAGETQDERYASFGTLADEILEFTKDIVDDKFF